MSPGRIAVGIALFMASAVFVFLRDNPEESDPLSQLNKSSASQLGDQAKGVRARLHDEKIGRRDSTVATLHNSPMSEHIHHQ